MQEITEKEKATRTSKKQSNVDWAGIGLSLGVTAAQGIILGLTTAGVGRVMSGSVSRRPSEDAGGSVLQLQRKSGTA